MRLSYHIHSFSKTGSGFFGDLRFELGVVKFGIDAARIDQFFMGALLDDHAVLENDDLISCQDR